MDERLERYRRMRTWRTKPEADTSIAPYLKQFVKDQTRLAKSLGDVAEAFEAAVPPEIASECTLVGIRGGVLTVETRSSAVRFALDRVLRSGGEATLRARAAAAGTTLARVRLVCNEG
ncbi:MAG: DciA family protein [Phycisphaerales bacterium]